MARPKTVANLQLPLGRALDRHREAIRALIASDVPDDAVRAQLATPDGFDVRLWAKAAQMEWAGALVAEEHGGAGGGLVEAGVLAEELGRALVPLPFLSTAVLGALTLAAAADEAVAAELLPRLADGSLRVAVAHDRDASKLALAADGRASGVLRNVIDGESADLVVAFADGGVAVAVAAGDGAAVREPSIDPTRRASRIELVDVPARRLGGPVAPEALVDVDARVAALVACELTGGARRCLELSIEWAGLREQFGRPIGTFQAIKHRCADMLVEVEAATAAARLAARLADARSPDLPAAAWLALAACSRAYRRAAADCIQIHGGVGYSWDHDAHLHLKRAKATEQLFGSPAHCDGRLAEALGL